MTATEKKDPKAPKYTIPTIELMGSGHNGCQGCGPCLTMRYVLKALGPRTIISVPACCWAVMPTVLPYTNMKIPMLYTAFEVTGASISGLRAALDRKGLKDVNVVGFAGDGGTFDIGIQALSGCVERNPNVIYVCYDNEAYMNTGVQRSGATPRGAWTTTTQVGTTRDWEKSPKKNMIDILVAHNIPYAATACISYPEDLIKKLQRAKDIPGTKFFHIFSPCPTGWRYPSEYTIEYGRKAVAARAFNIYEVENGKYKINMKPKQIPLKDYLMTQGRFKHLPDDMIADLQKEVDRDWERLLNKEKHCF